MAEFASIKDDAAISSVVSIHPYFNVPADRKADFDQLWKAIIPVVQEEAGCLHYEFASCGSMHSVRESYASADAALIHLANVAATIGQMSEFCTILRMDVVGSEVELAKLREPLAAMNPTFYVVEAGFRKEVQSADAAVCTIQPYFEVPAERIEDFKAVWAPLIPVVKEEEASQYYEIAYSGNKAFVRESYLGGEGILAHHGNAAETIGKILQYVTLEHPLQVWGNEKELSKVREAFSSSNPDFYVIEYGFRK